MKKIFSMLMFLMVVAFANAQSAAVKNGNATDTLKNADTLTYTISATAGYSAIGFQPVVIKVSGTVGGSVVLYGSLDGTNFVSLGDTLTLSNTATNTKLWAKVTTPYTHYRAVFISSGSQASIPKLYYVLRRHN